MNISNILTNFWSSIKSYLVSNYQPKGSYADSNHSHNYLPLSGGTLSGGIAFSGTCYTTVGTGSELSSDRYVVTTTKGANLGGALYLYGGDFENSWGEKGNFRLVAQSKEKGSKYLLGTPSGSLTWNGKELATQEYVNTNLENKANDSEVVKLSGSTITNNINKVGISCGWVDGRTNAVIKTNATSSPSNNQYVPCISAKSYQGSWELGTYTNNDYYLTYITDDNFNAGTNQTTAQYKFCSNGTLVASKFQCTNITLNGYVCTID